VNIKILWLWQNTAKTYGNAYTSSTKLNRHHLPVMLSSRGQVGLEAKILSSFSSLSSRIFLGLGLGLEYMSSTCPWTFHLGLVKLFVMLVLVICLSLQWFGIVMPARRARMSNSLFKALVFLKCNAHLWVAWRFDRVLNESNVYVTKLTMLSTVYLLLVSSS